MMKMDVFKSIINQLASSNINTQFTTLHVSNLQELKHMQWSNVL